MRYPRYLLIQVEFQRRRVEEYRCLYEELMDLEGIHLSSKKSPDRRDILRNYRELLELSKDHMHNPDVRVAIMDLTRSVSAYEFERATIQEPNRFDI